MTESRRGVDRPVIIRSMDKHTSILWCLECLVGYALEGIVPLTCPTCGCAAEVITAPEKTKTVCHLTRDDRIFLRSVGIDPDR